MFNIEINSDIFGGDWTFFGDFISI